MRELIAGVVLERHQPVDKELGLSYLRFNMSIQSGQINCWTANTDIFVHQFSSFELAQETFAID